MIKNGVNVLNLNNTRLCVNVYRSMSTYIVLRKIPSTHKDNYTRRRVSIYNNRLSKEPIRSKLTGKDDGNDRPENANKSPASSKQEAATSSTRNTSPKQTTIKQSETKKQGSQTSNDQTSEQSKWLESQILIPEQKTEEKIIPKSSKNIESDKKQEPAVSNVDGPLGMEDPIKETEDFDQFNKDDFLTTIFENMEPYMDTYTVYTQLVQAGFKPDQADEIINLLIVQLNSKLSKLSTKYSQVYELENERYLFESAQQELRVDITRSRESHIKELINLINILERDFNIISDELNNEFIQMKNDTQVAMNDQNSENTLHAKKIRLRIQETNHKITTELNSAMRSEIESLRWHISRWGLMAILVSVFSGCAVFYINKVKTMKRLQATNEFVPLVIYEPSEYDEDDYHTDLDESLIN